MKEARMAARKPVEEGTAGLRAGSGRSFTETCMDSGFIVEVQS